VGDILYCIPGDVFVGDIMYTISGDVAVGDIMYSISQAIVHMGKQWTQTVLNYRTYHAERYDEIYFV
jgi:hypothetical protein